MWSIFWSGLYSSFPICRYRRGQSSSHPVRTTGVTASGKREGPLRVGNGCIGSVAMQVNRRFDMVHRAFRRLSDNASIRITRSTPLSTKSIGSPPCRTSARSPTHPQQISVRDQLAFLISKRLLSGRRAGWLAALELGGGACVLPRVGPRGLGFRPQAFSF